MKNIIAAILTTLVVLFGACSTARAGDRGDKVAAAVGGFIGGVIVGSHIERGHDDHRRHHYPGYHPRISVGPRHVPYRHGPTGHWEDITTSVWIPGRWFVTIDHNGREVHHYENGYREYRTERVWVDYRYGPSYRR